MYSQINAVGYLSAFCLTCVDGPLHIDVIVYVRDA